MILYHFTDPFRIKSIKAHGIFKGDVPISIVGGYNAPWFTSDPSPADQKWAGGGSKTGVRLTIDFPDGDPKLVKWTDIMQKEIEKIEEHERSFRNSWYNALNKAGGDKQDNWYVYHGVVPPEWIVKVEKT